MRRKDLILLAAVILTGAVFQLLFIAVDGRDTPAGPPPLLQRPVMR